MIRRGCYGQLVCTLNVEVARATATYCLPFVQRPSSHIARSATDEAMPNPGISRCKGAQSTLLRAMNPVSRRKSVRKGVEETYYNLGGLIGPSSAESKVDEQSDDETGFLP